MSETLISPGTSLREQNISFSQPIPVEAGAAFIGPTVKGNVEVPTIVTSYGEYQRKFGTTFESGSTTCEFLTSIAVKSYFEQGGNTATVTRIVSGTFASADNTEILDLSGSTNPFTIETLGKGVIYNNSTASIDPGTENTDGSLVSGSADNLRWEIGNINNSKGTFSLLVRRGDDSRKNKIIIESHNNLSLDPNSENYIEKVIGNQTISKTVDGDGNVYVASTGEYVNNSAYIRVASVATPTLNYLANDGVTVGIDGAGASYSGSLPVAASGSFFGATGTNFQAGVKANFFTDINDTNTQGVEGTDYADSISMLTNKDEYKFKTIFTPGLVYEYGTHKTQIDSVVSLAENRGDCIYVFDLVGQGSTVAATATAAGTINTSYGATYWPWLQTQSATGKNVWIPASTVVGGVYAFTDGSSAPWYSPAGFIRGGIPNVIQAERKLARSDKDTLYAANVNPIGTFPGQGIVIMGQKTLLKKASSLDRVNVRRLVIELKDFVGKQADQLVFEQNTNATRNKFLSNVNPFLENVVQRQGLYAFQVKMDDTNNSADVIDRIQLVGQIFIQPTKSVEFIILDFVLEPTGATFNV
jgi:phage tail sheath protein FI